MPNLFINGGPTLTITQTAPPPFSSDTATGAMSYRNGKHNGAAVVGAENYNNKMQNMPGPGRGGGAMTGNNAMSGAGNDAMGNPMTRGPMGKMSNPMTAGPMMGNNNNNAAGMGNTAMGNAATGPAAVGALNQKNHRLAKELSDLRVRHREETRVVSRLTMENMNLASRCREAIAQVAALKKEIAVYQKRQGEWGALQREVVRLRRQIDNRNNAGITAGGGNPGGSAVTTASVTNQQKQQSPPGSANSLDLNIAGRSSSPTTDLDRIMSQQLKKQSVANKPGSSNSTMTATTTEKSCNDNQQEQQNPNNALLDNANLVTSSNTKIPISVASSKPLIGKSSNAGGTAGTSLQKDDEFDADIDMVDFFAKSQQNSSNGVVSNGSPDSTSSTSATHHHHLGSRTHHMRKPKSTDDPMPGDVISAGGNSSPGSTKKAASSSSSTAIMGGGNNSNSNNLLNSLDAFEASFASAFPETSFSTLTSDPGPLSTAKLDMSFDVPDFDPFFKSPSSSNKGSSSSGNQKQQDSALLSIGSNSSKQGIGTNSGTSGNRKGYAGTIKSSSTANTASGTSSMSTINTKSQMIQDLFPESAMNFKSSPKLGVLAFDSDPTDMTFDPMENMKMASPEKLDNAFARVPMRGGGGGKLSDSGSGSSSINEENNNKQLMSSKMKPGSGSRSSPLSPQSMSAEIEQLDAIANLASSTPAIGAEKPAAAAAVSDTKKHDGKAGLTTKATAAKVSANSNNNTTLASSSGRASTRVSLRRIKQPVSYAEPSTKAKLRRGDVLFPKVDAADKDKTMAGKLAKASSAKASDTETDLDRIMGQISSTSDTGSK